MKLFDRTGKPVEVPDDQAQAALTSGQYGAPAGTQIPVSIGGVVGSVPIEHLHDTLARGDAQIVSQAEYEKADLQARYGDVGHQVLAGGTEALDTATLGASDAAIGAVGGRHTREVIRKSREANPVSTGIGTGVGIVAPLVADAFSGGALTPEIAATVGEKVLARAGEKALVGAGEKAAAREIGVSLGAVEAAEAPAAEKALQIGGARRSVGLNPALEGEFASVEGGTNPIRSVADADPNAPLRAGLPEATPPFKIGAPRDADLFTDAGQPVFSRQPLADRIGLAPTEAPPMGVGPGITPNAGLEGGAGAARDAFQFGRVGSAPRTVSLADVEAKAIEDIRSAIQIHAPVPPEVAEGAARVAVAEAEPTVKAYGKGVIRQAVEGSLLGPQRLVTGGGAMVERAVSRIVGTEAETALGRIAQKAVAQAARGAFEGGIYNAGNELGHQFLQGDPELNGERLASAWFNGVLLGGAFGGGLGAVSQGGKEALTRVVGKEGISSYLTQKAGEHMWHAAGPTQKMTEEAARAGGIAKVGNLIRQDAEQLLGQTPKNREEMLKLSGLMQEKHAASLDVVLDRLDAEGFKGERVKLGDVLKDTESLIKQLRERAAPTGQLEALQNRIIDAAGARNALTGEINRNVRLPFRQLRDIRASVDDMAKWAPGPDKLPDAAIKTVRRQLEERVEKVADKVAGDAGGSLLKDYKAAKAGYQAGVLLEKAASRGVAKEATNQFLSLTDKLMEVPGAMIGHAVAGPVGGLIAGVATGNASKFVRQRFDFVVSDTLAKLANVSRNEHVLTAAQVSNERVQKRIDQGLNAVRKGLDGKAEEAAAAKAPTGGPQTFDERRKALLDAASQHEAVVEHLQNVTSPLDKAAPQVAGSLTSVALRSLTYLVDALPKPPPARADNLTPQLDAKDWEPSDKDKAAFNRKYDIVAHPEYALALVAAGEYTAQHHDALQTTHPKMLAAQQAKLQKELDKQTKAVPANMRPSIRLFLGKPPVDPGFSQRMQSNYAPAPPVPKPHKPLKMADTMTLNASKY